MTGRFTQLGRQLRKLRHIVGGSPSAVPMTTLRRATQLACDLACAAADVEEAAAGFTALAARGMLEPALAERLATWVASQATDVAAPRDDISSERAMAIGRDLDRLLRSLESGAPAPDAAFDVITPRAPAAKPDSTAAVPISGRIVEVEERGGRAVVAVDERPISMTLDAGEVVASFALAAAPLSRAEVHHEPTGVTRVVWTLEHLALELAPDFASVRLDTRHGHAGES